ncbi:MAG TPA: hypothetical protein ENJ43_04325 [Gammaproteobacteria bacterium]|nr:hypothetical protein [Gammaproteobacteria bacterium]
MKTAALSLEQTPPLSVPLRYFVTAPLFVMLAATLLLWFGPVALSSRWTPQLLAATHLVTLGCLTMVMFGATQQLLPILMASPLPRPRLTSALVHILLTGGTLLLAGGMLSGAPYLFQGAAGMLGAGILLFVGVTLDALRRSRSGHDTVWGIALALVALLVTAGAGLVLAGGYALGWYVVPRSLTNLHLVWGLLGWVGLLVVAVAYQVVPMFQLTPAYPPILMRWLAAVLLLSLLSWSVGRLLPAARPLSLGAGTVVVAGYGLFAFTTFWLQHRRSRRVADVNLDFWRVGLVSLLLALLLWSSAPLGHSSVGELLLGVLLIAGFAMSIINGMLYKIVPFLIWLHLNNRMQAEGRWEKIPNMRELISPRQSRWQFRLHSVALLLLLAAVVWPASFTRPAALLLFCSQALLGWNFLGALRIYQRGSAAAAPG